MQRCTSKCLDITSGFFSCSIHLIWLENQPALQSLQLCALRAGDVAPRRTDALSPSGAAGTQQMAVLLTIAPDGLSGLRQPCKVPFRRCT